MTRPLVNRVAGSLADRWDRRGFLGRTALVGTALMVNPLRYLLHPISAYAAVCNCRGRACGCGSTCCEGWTEFCCTLTGENRCPPGSVAAGWWRADGSRFCGGTRYYIDCNAVCTCEGGGSFCSGCDNQHCGCAHGDCGNWGSGCVAFRYGQCRQDLPRVGRIVCRVASCTPPYLFEPSCTTASASSNATANHARSCAEAQDPAAGLPLAATVAFLPSRGPDSGYWLVDVQGGVFSFGDADYLGSVTELRESGRAGPARVVAGASTAGGLGYWLADSAGGVFTFGDAVYAGSIPELTSAAAEVVGFIPTPAGRGYWVLDRRGGVFTFGDAPYLGSLPELREAGLAGAGAGDGVAMAPTPSGRGYWIADDRGGVFTFGDAGFFGSVAALREEGAVSASGAVPVVGMSASPSGQGYWVVDRVGGVFAFGDAEFLGSVAALRSTGAVGSAQTIGMAPSPSGHGYWLFDRLGGVFTFGDAPYRGSMPELRAQLVGA